MLRVSTTTLESFRRVMATPYGDEAELIAYVRRESIPTWQMQAGTAWDRLLSIYDRSVMRPVWEHDSWSFHYTALESAHVTLGPGQQQAKTVSVWDTWLGQVQVVAKVDHIRGLRVQENKATFSPACPKQYEQSLQWRFYLQCWDAQEVRYNLFSFAEPVAGFCELKDITSFSFFPYDELESECRGWLMDFLKWARAKQMLPYLEYSRSDFLDAA